MPASIYLAGKKMIHKKLLTYLFLLTTALAAPAAAGTLPSDAKPSPDVAWIVFGIKPENARIRLNQGLGAYLPEDGFIVAKGVPGKDYIMLSIFMKASALFGVLYNTCDNLRFYHAEGGKVLYFGSLDFVVDGSKLKSNSVDDLEGARAFLKTHYPDLSDSLERGRVDAHPTPYSCNPGFLGNGLVGVLARSVTR